MCNQRNLQKNSRFSSETFPIEISKVGGKRASGAGEKWCNSFRSKPELEVHRMFQPSATKHSIIPRIQKGNGQRMDQIQAG